MINFRPNKSSSKFLWIIMITVGTKQIKMVRLSGTHDDDDDNDDDQH